MHYVFWQAWKGERDAEGINYHSCDVQQSGSAVGKCRINEYHPVVTHATFLLLKHCLLVKAGLNRWCHVTSGLVRLQLPQLQVPGQYPEEPRCVCLLCRTACTVGTLPPIATSPAPLTLILQHPQQLRSGTCVSFVPCYQSIHFRVKNVKEVWKRKVCMVCVLQMLWGWGTVRACSAFLCSDLSELSVQQVA